ncbi:MAG: SprB repeat-containing protein, partial [Bacteroidota bacterium]
MNAPLQPIRFVTIVVTLFYSASLIHAQPVCGVNLWFNGNFETTTNYLASGWNAACLPTYTPIVMQFGTTSVTNNTPGGSYFIWLDHKLTSCINEPAGSNIPFLSQTITTEPGYNYTFGMWTWAFCQPDDLGTIGLAIDGVLCTTFDAVPSCPPGWVYLSCEFTATSNSTVFTIMDVGYGQQGWDFAVDDISVVATGATLPPQTIPKCANDCEILNMFSGGNSYNWSPATGLSSTSSPTPQTCIGEAIVYDVSYSSSGGCPITGQVSIEVFTNPTASITGQDIICPVEQVLLESVVSGTEPFQYQWSTGGNLSALLTNAPGTYSLTVTDANGCTDAPASFTIMPAPPLEAYIEGYPAVICEGESAELYAFAYDPGPFTYLWSNGSQDFSLSAINPGTYTVTVTNSKACSGVASYTVEKSRLFFPAISGQTTFCQGDSTLLTANVTGQGTFTYQWNTGAASQSIVVVSAGQYTVTVTNQDGCTKSVSRITSFAPTPQPVIAGDEGICRGDSGALTVYVAGPGTFNYIWSNGQVGDTIVVTAPGAYSVTATNAINTCAGVAHWNVLDWQAKLQLSGQTAVCAGDTTILQAAGIFSSYVWNVAPPNNQSSIRVSQAGTYILSVIDSNGCGAVDSLQLVTFPVDSTFLAAQTCDSTQAGIFIQTLQNVFGCDSIIITNVTLLPSSETLLFGVTCDLAQAGVAIQIWPNQFGCDSTVITTLTFIPPDTTLLNYTTCDSSGVGVFVQTLTNQFGCDSTVITNATFALADTTFLSATTCNPGAAGIFTAYFMTAEGCDSVVITDISLLPNSVTAVGGFTCNPAEAGVFIQVLSNQYGCDSTITTTVTFVPLDTVFLYSATCNPDSAGVSVQHFVSASNCDSVVVRSVSLLPVDSTFLSLNTCNPAEAGVFIGHFVNQFGCDSTVTTTVSLLPGNDVFVSKTTCDPASAGSFFEVFTNQFGCDSTVTTTVTFVPPDTTLLNSATCDPAATGLFVQTLANQYGCDSIVMTTTVLVLADTTFLYKTTCNPAEAGVFMNVLSNQYGCDSTVTTTVTFVPLDTVFLYGATCNPDSAGVFVEHLASALNCDSTVVRSIVLLPVSSTFLTGNTCNPAEAGVFVYHFVNQFGCDSTVTSTVTLLPSSDTTYLNVETCNPDDLGISVVTLPNIWGCDSVITTTTVLLPPAYCNLSIALSGATIPCDKDTGTLTITVSVGLPPFLFEVLAGNLVLASGSVPAVGVPYSIVGLPAGIFTVNIISPNGLARSASVEIIQASSPVLNIGVTSNFSGFAVSCNDAADGTATVMAQGGFPPYTVNWSNGQTGAEATGLSAKMYAVTVTDAAGCAVSQSLQLDAPPPMLPKPTVTDPDCFEQAQGRILINVQGGIPPYSFALDNGG